MQSHDSIARRLTYLQERKNRSKTRNSARRCSATCSITEPDDGIDNTIQSTNSAAGQLSEFSGNSKSVETECENFVDLCDRDMRRTNANRYNNRAKRDRRENITSNSATVDFGKVLAERSRKSRWLQNARKARAEQSDYERYSLEYVLRRRYDTNNKAPHVSQTTFDEQNRAAEWERDVLFKAMQSTADKGMTEYVLVLQGPWSEKTLRTVREPDLFGRAVHYLLQNVFHSTQLRVRCNNHSLNNTRESEDCNKNIIRLKISWDEVESNDLFNVSGSKEAKQESDTFIHCLSSSSHKHAQSGNQTCSQLETENNKHTESNLEKDKMSDEEDLSETQPHDFTDLGDHSVDELAEDNSHDFNNYLFAFDTTYNNDNTKTVFEDHDSKKPFPGLLRSDIVIPKTLHEEREMKKAYLIDSVLGAQHLLELNEIEQEQKEFDNEEEEDRQEYKEDGGRDTAVPFKQKEHVEETFMFRWDTN